MGGYGNGRRWQYGADTTDDCRSIDVRRLKRDGLLSLGQAYGWQWSRQGEVVASIRIRTEHGRIALSYRHRSGGADWQDISYPVGIETTPCHLGGERHWFQCPARGCGRRVAILYGGTIFACRHCHRLAYPSQREKPWDRAARRADGIRDKMGWPGGILEGGDWGKPKGMHWRTYERLFREHDALSDRALVGIMEQLGRLPAWFCVANRARRRRGAVDHVHPHQDVKARRDGRSAAYGPHGARGPSRIGLKFPREAGFAKR